MKNVPIALAAGISCVCIAAAAFYLVPETPTASETVQSLQKRLAESDRIIAELRARESSPGASDAGSVERSRAPDFAADFSRSDGGDAAAAERLEKLALRMEQRVESLEKQMKTARLIPMTPEEKEAEIRREKESLVKMKQQLNERNEDVRRYARVLNVPESVANLSPYEAADDPTYQRYRPYLQAKKEVGYLQKYATDEEGKILGLEMSCS